MRGRTAVETHRKQVAGDRGGKPKAGRAAVPGASEANIKPSLCLFRPFSVYTSG